MTWLHVTLMAVSSLVGGFIGGWVVAFRLGSWRQQVEDRIATTEKRLERGDPHVGAVPVLSARLEVVLEELRAIRAEIRENRNYYVSRKECDLRHEENA